MFRGDKVLRGFDEECRAQVQENIEKKGIKVCRRTPCFILLTLRCCANASIRAETLDVEPQCTGGSSARRSLGNASNKCC